MMEVANVCANVRIVKKIQLPIFWYYPSASFTGLYGKRKRGIPIIVTLLLFPISFLREKSDLYYVQYLFTSFLAISDCVLI